MPAWELSAWQPPRQISPCAASSKQGHHEGMMCGGSGGEIGGRGARSGNSSTMQIFALIDHGSRRHPTAAMGSRSRQQSIQQSTNILFNIVKTRKKYCYYYFYDYFWHNALTNCRAQSLPVVMVIRPTQSVGGDNSGTYMLYMSPLTARVLGLAHRPWSGPRQMTAGDY